MGVTLPITLSDKQFYEHGAATANAWFAMRLCDSLQTFSSALMHYRQF